MHTRASTESLRTPCSKSPCSKSLVAWLARGALAACSGASLAGCASLFHEPERGDVVPKGEFALGGTVSTAQRWEAAKQNFQPTNDMNIGVTGVVDASYGLFEGAEIALAGTYLGQAYGGSGRFRYRWLEAGNGRLTSVASAGGFAGQYQASDFTFYPTIPFPYFYVNRVDGTAYGGSVASSTGYKLNDMFSVYAGPKIYFLQMNAKFNGSPAIEQQYSYSGPAYQAFAGVALKVPLGGLEGIIDLMGTATMMPANARTSNLAFVPGAAITLLLQTRRSGSATPYEAAPSLPTEREAPAAPVAPIRSSPAAPPPRATIAPPPMPQTTPSEQPTVRLGPRKRPTSFPKSSPRRPQSDDNQEP